MNDRFDVLERFERLLETPEPSFERFMRRRDRKRRNQRIAAGVVGLAVFVAAIWVTTGIPIQRTGTPADTGPSAVSTPTDTKLPGLPSDEAPPSTPTTGNLILSLEMNSLEKGPLSMWVYEDGRYVWWFPLSPYLRDSNAPESATGLYQQRLTPQGVEMLRSEVVSTGLFERDLALLRGPGDPFFFTMRVLNGNGLVWLTWAVEENYRVPKDAPSATPEQARTLEELSELLTSLETRLPLSSWEDRSVAEYVPSRFAVCFRGFPKSVGHADVPGLLPESAASLLGGRLTTLCPEMTIAEARQFARALLDSGIEPLRPRVSWLKFILETGSPSGNELWISFAPVLPHGEAIFMGPG
jgi:hypothetical protein